MRIQKSKWLKITINRGLRGGGENKKRLSASRMERVPEFCEKHNTKKENKMGNKNYQFLVLGFVICICFFSFSQAETLVQKEKAYPSSINALLISNEYQSYPQLISDSDFRLVSQKQYAQLEEDKDIYAFKSKSTKRAFIYSLALPGAGEFYAGSKIKAGLFFGVEAALWALHFSYQNKGNKKEDEYRDFANAHWDEQEYREWYESLPDSTKDKLTHKLPDTKTQQYYEMIGKYDQFQFAWDDFNEVESISANRFSYVGMRKNANDLLDKAKYAIMGALGNHILSAFDAAFSAKRYNKKMDRLSGLKIRIEMAEYEQKTVPMLSVSYRF